MVGDDVTYMGTNKTHGDNRWLGLDESSGCFKQDRKVAQTPLKTVRSWQTG